MQSPLCSVTGRLKLAMLFFSVVPFLPRNSPSTVTVVSIGVYLQAYWQSWQQVVGKRIKTIEGPARPQGGAGPGGVWQSPPGSTPDPAWDAGNAPPPPLSPFQPPPLPPMAVAKLG